MMAIMMEEVVRIEADLVEDFNEANMVSDSLDAEDKVAKAEVVAVYVDK